MAPGDLGRPEGLRAQVGSPHPSLGVCSLEGKGV